MSSFHWPQASDYIRSDGGHPPSRFAQALAEAIPVVPRSTRVLDIGCGSGIVGLYCLIQKKAAFVTFSDVLGELVDIARGNVEDKITRGSIHPSQTAFIGSRFSDLPENVVLAHDVVAFNPPQLPDRYTDRIDGDTVTKTFRHGGSDGLDVTRGFLRWYSGLKSPKPDAVIVLSCFLGRSRIAQALRDHGLVWNQLGSIRIPLRPFLQAAAESLADNPSEIADRSLKKDDDGVWTKQVMTLLIRGSRNDLQRG